VVRLLDREAVMEKLVYCLTNPVKDRLVAKVHQWPGANSYVAMRKGEPLRAERPRHFFRKDGAMPEAVEVELTLPELLGERSAVVCELVERVRVIEQSCAETRHASGCRVIGRREILEESWTDTPTSEEPRSELLPMVASRDREVRLKALSELSAFRNAYCRARDALLRGATAIFPLGTYWLQRFAAVPLADA